jgi:hypothetical protein
VTPIGVKMKPIVVLSPTRADGRRAFENGTFDPCLLEAGGRSQACRSGTDDDRAEIHAMTFDIV